MKTLLILFCLAFIAFTGFTEKNNHASIDRMPDNFEFDTNAVIRYYNGGGMRYESLKIEVRFDSCIRVDMEMGKEIRTAFAMTAEMRANWEKFMRNAGSSYIYSSRLNEIIHDKATTELCFGAIGFERCISSGASSEVNERGREGFKSICDEMIRFSASKGK